MDLSDELWPLDTVLGMQAVTRYPKRPEREKARVHVGDKRTTAIGMKKSERDLFHLSPLGSNPITYSIPAWGRGRGTPQQRMWEWGAGHSRKGDGIGRPQKSCLCRRSWCSWSSGRGGSGIGILLHLSFLPLFLSFLSRPSLHFCSFSFLLRLFPCEVAGAAWKNLRRQTRNKQICVKYKSPLKYIE